MSKTLVLGASGGMGQAIVKELIARGKAVVAVTHSDEGEQRLLKLFAAQGDGLMEVKRCDVRDLDRLQQVISGTETVFHCLGLPYPQWKHWPLLIENVIKAVQSAEARLVHIDNVYPYGYAKSERVDENHPKQPHTRKGKIRKQMGDRLLQAHAAGVPSLIVHFPDFYGAGARNSMLNMTLEGLAQGKTAIFVGDVDVRREYVYLPDGAKAAVELAFHPDAYGECWNVPGAGTISGREIAAIAADVTGKPARLRSVGRGMMRMAGLFDRNIWEAVEMLYLTKQPLVLSGSKYESRIGPLPRTDYRVGIAETLQSYF
jgi:nucleoside-diphosphate-sugar epimerase